ncbi:LCP family protein [Streptomyces sp. AC550_RSS872]|uniref:LCP family protein n=1 Tax=Streptomyces sp. AC550_RSS872 TaxID=2823689 RepID=UPI001C27FFF6|nr:LCP family protein [Streptomyces sp. AC550_RSS872]
MNDRYDAGAAGYEADQYELVGYDEYGQPVYRQIPAQQQAPQQQYDPYGQQGYGYDPYATGRQQPVPPYDPYGTGDTGQQPPTPAYDPYGTGTHPQQGAHSPPYDPYGRTATSGQQHRVAEQTAYIPQQAGPVEEPQLQERGDRGDREYHTEQFSFVEEPDGDSEDVIDWLKFTENRTERREEARRRARARVVALVVVLAVVAAGGAGYLWYAGKLPGLSSSDSKEGTATAVGAQKRDVIVVHLHNTKKGGTSTALLVDNTTTNQGTTVLLPNSLALTGDDGTTTLAKSVDDDGSSGTRDAIDTVLGTEIQGTWRLDTPYLQNLVDLVGNIEVDTNADVPDPDAKAKGSAPLVRKGKAQTLSGKMAVAYATYQASGEAQNAQLERFGQVMQATLRKLTSDTQGATVTVQTLGMIIEPPLTDKDLGAFLAKLAELAKGGDYKTAMLPVRTDGTLSARASAAVVKDVLGGTAKSPDKGAAVRVSIRNASGVKDNTEKARVVLLNGGFTFLEGGTASAEATSEVVYADTADKADATEVAKTLGLSADAVTKGDVSGNADVSVVLGQDYKPSSS